MGKCKDLLASLKGTARVEFSQDGRSIRLVYAEMKAVVVIPREGSRPDEYVLTREVINGETWTVYGLGAADTSDATMDSPLCRAGEGGEPGLTGCGELRGGGLTLKGMQEEVDGWIRSYGVRYFGELTNMACLTEEVGELARVMVRTYGEQSPKSGEGAPTKEALADEMADVLWVLTCLANQTGVDLEEAFRKNVAKKTGRDSERHRNNPKLAGGEASSLSSRQGKMRGRTSGDETT